MGHVNKSLVSKSFKTFEEKNLRLQHTSHCLGSVQWTGHSAGSRDDFTLPTRWLIKLVARTARESLVGFSTLSFPAKYESKSTSLTLW
jgi:hypothetical protein